MKKAGLKIFKISILLGLIFAAITLHFLLPKLIVDTSSSKTPAYYKQAAPKNTQVIRFQSFDKTKIVGHYGRVDSLPKGTIILLHGIRGYKEYFSDLAAQLQDSGYNTLALDLRAHGSSGGDYCTYGYHEKKDIAAAIDFLLSQPQADSNIGVWGQSLGGAIALQSLAYDKRLKFGIVESTFSELETIVHDYSERMFGFSIPWVNDYAISRAGTMANFDPLEVSPSTSATNITQPILIAHGKEDKHISFAYGKANYDNLKSKNKIFLPIEGALHHNVWQVGDQTYFDEIFKFLSSLELK